MNQEVSGRAMSDLDRIVRELVIANRILANEDVVASQSRPRASPAALLRHEVLRPEKQHPSAAIAASLPPRPPAENPQEEHETNERQARPDHSGLPRDS